MTPPRQSKLDEIIEELALNHEHRTHKKDCLAGEVYRESRTALNQYMLDSFIELIGEDENYESETFGWDDQKLQAERNQLRNQLRQAARSKYGQK